MGQQEILKKLRSIPNEKWEKVLTKCHNHVEIKLFGKMISGAHCEQRLGMSAADFYFGKAIKAIYGGNWQWKYEQYTIEEQLIRIIDSMISEEVRKYKVEMKHNRTTLLVENNQLVLAFEDGSEDQQDTEEHLLKLNAALKLACENNERYKEFIYLKQQKLSYHDISKKLNCSINDIYQIMENIARRARKILKSQH